MHSLTFVCVLLVAVALCAGHGASAAASGAAAPHRRRVPPSTCNRNLDCSSHGRCGRWALWSDHYHVVSLLQQAMTGALAPQRLAPSDAADDMEADVLADALALLEESGAAHGDALWLDEGEAAPMLELLSVETTNHVPTQEEEEKAAEANAPAADDAAFANWVSPKAADGRSFDLSDGFDTAQGDWDEDVRLADALDEDDKDAHAVAEVAGPGAAAGRKVPQYMPSAAEVAALAAHKDAPGGAVAASKSLSLLALAAKEQKQKQKVKRRVAVWTPNVWPNTCRCDRGWSGTYCNHATGSLAHAVAGKPYPWPAASDLPPVRANTYRVTCELLTRQRKHVFRKEVRAVPDACRSPATGEGDCFYLSFQNFKIPQKGFIKCTLKEKPLEAAKVAGMEEKVKFQGAYVLAKHDRHTTAVYATSGSAQVQVALKVQQVNGDSDIDALVIKLDQAMFTKLDAARNPQPVDLQSSVAAMETADAHHARREHMLSAKVARTKRPAGVKARSVPEEAKGDGKKASAKGHHVPRAQPYDRKYAKLIDAAKRGK